MQTFAQIIEEAVFGAPIEAVVIGRDGRATGPCEFEPWQHVVLSWGEGRPHLDYEVDNSGAGHAIYVYTPAHVVFLTEYDGTYSLKTVPRHPVGGEPEVH